MNEDMELVRGYEVHQSEAAFETIVSRHINLVYSAAVRQVHDPHLAEEITQAVFVLLAQKAGRLGPRTILASWLYRTARYAAADALKARRRREQREHEASMLDALNEAADETWAHIEPLLDGAMEKLGEKDHSALVLRFFENRNYQEVGAALGMSEAAAKMRVHRALEKLRSIFKQQGIRLTTAIIAGTIATHSVQAAPMALAKPVAAVATANGVGASASTLTLVKGALKLMAWTKVKTVVVAGLVILAAAGTATVAIQHLQHKRAQARHRMFPQPNPNSAAGLSMSAARFIAALCHRGQLPGFPEGKTYVRKGNSDPGLIQVLSPGLTISPPGVYHFADTNLESYPVSLNLVASKNNNGQFVYNFRVIKTAETNEWQLTRAWRTDLDGKDVEEFSVQ